MIFTLLYYFIFSSVILVYGIGINRATVISDGSKKNFLLFIKMLFTVSATSVLTYLITIKLFVPVQLGELYPFLAVLLYVSISVFMEAIIRITAKRSSAEFTVSLLCVLLAVNESNSILECFLISMVFTVSFFLLLPLLFSIKKRIEIASPAGEFKNASLILISIAALILILLVYDVSWINPEVFK